VRKLFGTFTSTVVPTIGEVGRESGMDICLGVLPPSYGFGVCRTAVPCTATRGSSVRSDSILSTAMCSFPFRRPPSNAIRVFFFVTLVSVVFAATVSGTGRVADRSTGTGRPCPASSRAPPCGSLTTAAEARKVLISWARRCTLAYAFLWEYSSCYKRLKLGPTSGPTWRLSHLTRVVLR
jgi:hypothetical protein